MASIKISQLTETTGYSYNDVLAIVDSGSTATKKITTGHLLNNTPSRISDQTSQDTNTFIGAGSDVNSSSTESIFQGSTKYSGVMFGVGTMNNSSDSVILGSTGGGGGVSMDNSSASLVLGGFRSTLNNSTRATNIVSQDFSLDLSLNSGGIGINNGHVLSCNKAWNIGGQNVGISNSTEALLGASRNSSINLAGGNSGVLLGSKSSTINLSNPSAEITGIYSCDNSSISTTEPHSVLLNSKDTTITAGQGRTMASVSGRTSVFDWTTHTDNIHTFKTETFTETNGGNVGGSIDVDCSQSTFYFFTMTADTSVNFTNVRDGQRFMFIVYNNGSWSVTGATLNGVGSKVYAKNGTINPTNNGYSKYVATYDSVNGFLFLDEELGFAAV